MRMKKQGVIDSMCFSSFSFESLFSGSDFKIVTVKGIGECNSNLWKQTFGKPLTKNINEAKIIYTSMGLTIALKRYSRNKHMQVIEFAGLHGFTERSRLLNELIIELIPRLQESFIKRIDICFDYERTPKRAILNILEKRRAFIFKNTTYFKTDKEKKVNACIDIKTYNKKIQAKLTNPLQRLEFCFKGSYFKDIRLCDLDRKVFSRMEKTISKFSGINSKISL